MARYTEDAQPVIVLGRDATEIATAAQIATVSEQQRRGTHYHWLIRPAGVDDSGDSDFDEMPPLEDVDEMPDEAAVIGAARATSLLLGVPHSVASHSFASMFFTVTCTHAP